MNDWDEGAIMTDAVTLGDELTVSPIGFGGMALTPVYGEVDDDESLATLHRSIDLGVTFIDTANVYGSGENERLIARLLGDRRDEVTLATKFGIVANPADSDTKTPGARGDAAYVRQCIDESLARLNTDVVDLYYMHRRDVRVPIEETVGAMAELVAAGKVRHLGLSEVTADELRAAVATSRATWYPPPPNSASASSLTRRWAADSSRAPSGPHPTWPRERTSGAGCRDSPAMHSRPTWRWST
jgi:aryl-alcohol dehydrogenase-like predicted oxidoreductase